MVSAACLSSSTLASGTTEIKAMFTRRSIIEKKVLLELIRINFNCYHSNLIIIINYSIHTQCRHDYNTYTITEDKFVFYPLELI